MRLHRFIEDLLGDKAQVACLKLLRKNPQLSGRELAKQASVSQFKIRSVLQSLSSHGLLKMRVFGKAYLYSLNKRHILIQRMKPLLELEDDFFAFFGQWVMRQVPFKPISLVLFGSMARGEERPESDIDLLVILKKMTPENEILDKIHHCLAEAIDVFGNRIAPVLTTPKDFEKAVKKKDPFFLKILKEGVVIAGSTMSEVLL